MEKNRGRPSGRASRPVTIRLPEARVEKLRERAVLEDRPQTTIVRRALEFYFRFYAVAD